MNAFWDYYWPAITAALVIGALAGAVGFRLTKPVKKLPPQLTRRRALAIGAGLALVLGIAALWHGPFGVSARFASAIESRSRQVLVDFEMNQVQARLERDPLRRTLVLSGPADDFQRSELVRIMDGVPGVANVRWMNSRAPYTLPLLAEAELAALAGFGLGLVLSYLLELRRRSRAEWRW